jgi:hypothetical protein
MADTSPGKPVHPLLPRLGYWGKGEGSLHIFLNPSLAGRREAA